MIGIVGVFSLYFFLCNRGVLQGDTVSFSFFALSCFDANMPENKIYLLEIQDYNNNTIAHA